jgi:cytochrome b pre-mRNA-processing protein 6
VQFQEVLRKRFEAPKISLSEEEQLKQANALYSLLDNRYKKTVSITLPGSQASYDHISKYQGVERSTDDALHI